MYCLIWANSLHCECPSHLCSSIVFNHLKVTEENCHLQETGIFHMSPQETSVNYDFPSGFPSIWVPFVICLFSPSYIVRLSWQSHKVLFSTGERNTLYYRGISLQTVELWCAILFVTTCGARTPVCWSITSAKAADQSAVRAPRCPMSFLIMHYLCSLHIFTLKVIFISVQWEPPLTIFMYVFLCSVHNVLNE